MSDLLPSTPPVGLRFSVTLDVDAVFTSITPDAQRVRVNLTGLEGDQLERIVMAITDTPEEAQAHFLALVEQHLKR